ncbi:hypothetical protein ABZ921_17045 [Streptomyces atriruber]|uniref:Uncharacterized protein n=1 Tax=Streptomyces atriruber TaxID=545121 RepID=A0ABV3BMX7_9ACTN
MLDDAGLLHFALTGTDNENVSRSAIHLDLVKRMVGGARAKARVLVLDCCFAARRHPYGVHRVDLPWRCW